MQRNRSPTRQKNTGSVSKHGDEKCRQNLLSQLKKAKEEGVVKKSLTIEQGEFEKLEFYGDALLYQHISRYIMMTRRFMDPHLMTQLRTSIVRNSNLARVFEKLDLGQLIDKPIDPSFFTLKNKADTVEAIIGELAEHHHDDSLLSELISFISYVGENQHSVDANEQEREDKSKGQKAESSDLSTAVAPTTSGTTSEPSLPEPSVLPPKIISRPQPIQSESIVQPQGALANGSESCTSEGKLTKPVFFTSSNSRKPSHTQLYVQEHHSLHQQHQQPFQPVFLLKRGKNDSDTGLAKLFAQHVIDAREAV